MVNIIRSLTRFANGIDAPVLSASRSARLEVSSQAREEKLPMKVETSGMDLARELFQIHGVDGVGKTRLCKTLRRGTMSRVFSNQGLCLFGLEACGGAHHWARELRKLGHDVHLIAPQFVAPCRKNDRSNGNDAEAIGEAMVSPTMRFVTIKDTERQAALVLPRV
jgi:transposase